MKEKYKERNNLTKAEIRGAQLRVASRPQEVRGGKKGNKQEKVIDDLEIMSANVCGAAGAWRMLDEIVKWNADVASLRELSSTDMYPNTYPTRLFIGSQSFRPDGNRQEIPQGLYKKRGNATSPTRTK